MEIKCPYCDGIIEDSVRKCKHCGEWLQSASQNTSVVSPISESNKFSHLDNDEKWNLKTTLTKLCNYAIFLVIIITIQDIMTEYSVDTRKYKWITAIPSFVFIAIAAILDIFIYLKLRRYFSSLHSLFTQFIIVGAVYAFLNMFYDELEYNDAFVIISTIVTLIALVYYVVIGVKISKQYKENALLGKLFIAYPCACIALLIIQSISYVDLWWLMSIIEAVILIAIYNAISSTVKVEYT